VEAVSIVVPGPDSDEVDADEAFGSEITSSSVDSKLFFSGENGIINDEIFERSILSSETVHDVN